MKRVYVNEKWCLGCHLCEYNCAFANSGKTDMVKALKNVTINPRIQVEEKDGVCFAVQCRHCEEPLCVKGCITGALTIKDGVITIDKSRCVGCYTCVITSYSIHYTKLYDCSQLHGDTHKKIINPVFSFKVGRTRQDFLFIL